MSRCLTAKGPTSTRIEPLANKETRAGNARRLFALPVGWACIILVGTSVPQLGVEGPEGTDKLLHFAAYFVLGALCAPIVGVARRKGAIFAAALGGVFLFAALDEAHQLFIRGRAASMFDWVADAAGAACGMTVGYVTTMWRRDLS